jgi:hypothetical protein
MMDQNKRKPSRFALSRYILEESDPDEKRRIESWRESSDEARIAFEEFKTQLAQEECAFIPLKQLHFGEPKQFQLGWLKPSWAIPFALALLVVAAVVILPLKMSRNLHAILFTDRQTRHVIQPTKTFHDTLETLLQITSRMLIPNKRILMADSQVNAVHSPQHIKRFPLYISGADRTAVTLE